VLIEGTDRAAKKNETTSYLRVEPKTLYSLKTLKRHLIVREQAMIRANRILMILLLLFQRFTMKVLTNLKSIMHAC